MINGISRPQSSGWGLICKMIRTTCKKLCRWMRYWRWTCCLESWNERLWGSHSSGNGSTLGYRCVRLYVIRGWGHWRSNRSMRRFLHQLSERERGGEGGVWGELCTRGASMGVESVGSGEVEEVADWVVVMWGVTTYIHTRVAGINPKSFDTITIQ